jgi:hypothetical protein
MTLIFRQNNLDNLSVYSFQSCKNGKFITEYVAECDGWHSGKYEVEYTETYFQALRMLAKLKNNL